MLRVSWSLSSSLLLWFSRLESHASSSKPQISDSKPPTRSLRGGERQTKQAKSNFNDATTPFQWEVFIKMHLPGDRLKGDGTSNAFLPSEHLVWRKFPLEEFTLKHSNRSISFISISLEVFPSEAFPVKKIPFKAFYSKNSPSNEICTSFFGCFKESFIYIQVGRSFRQSATLPAAA